LVADEPNVAHRARLREELENLKVVGARVNPLHQHSQVVAQRLLALLHRGVRARRPPPAPVAVVAASPIAAAAIVVVAPPTAAVAIAVAFTVPAVAVAVPVPERTTVAAPPIAVAAGPSLALTLALAAAALSSAVLSSVGGLLVHSLLDQRLHIHARVAHACADGRARLF
jgi:hypothetical protein